MAMEKTKMNLPDVRGDAQRRDARRRNVGETRKDG